MKFSAAYLLIAATAIFTESVTASKGKVFDHILQIWFENQDYDVVAKTSGFTNLQKYGILLDNYNALTHPSQPNYVASAGGSNYGITDDSTSTISASVKTIFDLLEKAGLTWKLYQEDIPSVGWTGTRSGLYVRKHNPAVSYASINKNSTRLKNIVSSTQFATDIANKNLPNWMFYTPNLDNDGHERKQKQNKNLSIHTKAKIKKTTTLNTGKSNIISRLSINSNTSTSLFSKSFTTANSNKADPSQIIITKAIPPQSLKNRLGSQKETAISRGKISNVLSSRLGPRHNITTTPTVITATKSTRTAATFDRPVAEKGSSLSIRGRSHATSSPSGLSIKGESGPTTVLIAGLDRGTNSEDVRLVCEDFGNVLKCEVLRNRMGDSFGEAEVEFSSKSAALDCIAKLDNVKADGQYLRVILRENKLPRSYSATQISSIISTPSTTSSGKMYSDQPSRYGTTRR
ncbi:hypothetical protein G6F32_004720 [Rhizopus arrhizus]|nr:hypothetical protein G6F32_004720 [Rhizopus arrhizus]